MLWCTARTIAFGKNAYIITARTDTGKTTTLLKILSHQRRNNDRASFLSDDMTIVSEDGIALTYPKPLTISYHTMKAVNSATLNFQGKNSFTASEPDPLAHWGEKLLPLSASHIFQLPRLICSCRWWFHPQNTL